MFTKAPGIEDIFPDRIDSWNRITGAAREAFRRYNFREIIIPVMEFTDVFVRGLGDETDIVSKEMFTFEDRGGRSLTLRPEGTASVVRAYVENGEFNRLSMCRLFYIGPMFRAERPQRGRLRQFNQFGAELFGGSHPFHDFEVIAMMDDIARAAGITGYGLLVNSIGCPECRPGFVKELVSYYSDKKDSLCDDCRRRLGTNPLRILDCKVEGCRRINMDAPKVTDHLCEACRTHHGEVKSLLDGAGIAFTEDPRLVRGLDYYTRTTFEFTASSLGGQNAFAAGGRYDNLVGEFGGKPTPAVGFAAGIERMMLLTGAAGAPRAGLDAYVVHTGGAAYAMAVRACATLRSAGVSADMDPETKGFKAQFKRADREGASFAVIIGEDEAASGSFSVKDLVTGEQVGVPGDRLAAHVAAGISSKKKNG